MILHLISNNPRRVHRELGGIGSSLQGEGQAGVRLRVGLGSFRLGLGRLFACLLALALVFAK